MSWVRPPSTPIILHNHDHHWPVGGLHVVASHCLPCATCQKMIDPTGLYELYHITFLVNVQCAMLTPYIMYGHAMCHPCSVDTCHLDPLTLSFFPVLTSHNVYIQTLFEVIFILLEYIIELYILMSFLR
jgi:hypothetical protein